MTMGALCMENQSTKINLAEKQLIVEKQQDSNLIQEAVKLQYKFYFIIRISNLDKDRSNQMMETLIL